MIVNRSIKITENDPRSIIKLQKLDPECVAVALPAKIFCPGEFEHQERASTCIQTDRPTGSVSGAMVWIWDTSKDTLKHRFFHSYVQQSATQP